MSATTNKIWLQRLFGHARPLFRINVRINNAWHVVGGVRQYVNGWVPTLRDGTATSETTYQSRQEAVDSLVEPYLANLDEIGKPGQDTPSGSVRCSLKKG
jgi:hypothetical protein